MEYHGVSLFSLGGTALVTFGCSCGCHMMSVSRKRKRIWLEMACALCEESHVISFVPSEFWSPNPKPLLCTETGVEIGFIGSDEAVRAVVQRHQAQVDTAMADAGFHDFFDEPDVMYEVLHYLKGWAEGGALSCPCGNRKIEVSIHPDRLELHCHTCGRFNMLSATSWRDVECLKSMEPLEVNERGRRLFPDS